MIRKRKGERGEMQRRFVEWRGNNILARNNVIGQFFRTVSLRMSGSTSNHNYLSCLSASAVLWLMNEP